ncbi:E3 ubiquitin-protein ligase MIB2 [Cocos nucifera]|uniref:E3 ubiquitin-protein ligase MIB2 n=1 Tax=Cocos nucifera TaxID=13894 RepID=A0A8K0ICY2_COCNU|nr:E3 ubiquitin-protein ligase MIB2 [Cocos nucifera]
MAEVAIEGGGEIRSDDANISSAQREAAQRKIEKELFTSVMEGNWEKVVGFYKNESVPTKINPAGDTILHLAILTGLESGVIKLMELMEEQDKTRMEQFVQTKNDWGNTPLHQAAFVGMVEVCEFIANQYRTQQVVQPRNNQGETPLHVAVLHGHIKVFCALQTVNERKGWGAMDRKDGGNTILHSAIFREHFGE